MQHKIGVIPFDINNNRLAIMFVTSQKRGRWILPKGNLKDNETHKQGCKREAFEEAGIKGKLLKDYPITAVISKTTSEGLQNVAVTYYPLLVSEQFEDWPEKATRERHWSLLQDAHYVTDNDDFSDLLKKFKAMTPWLLEAADHKK
ncbi:NUDIX hydrolase [Alphaproteobacteria bacterium]|nr:NUDIX hydrolase [bacterium]MDC0147382.1 NUDIX hydrolase [Alphaproteobacteria bacterium]